MSIPSTGNHRKGALGACVGPVLSVASSAPIGTTAAPGHYRSACAGVDHGASTAAYKDVRTGMDTAGAITST